MRRLPSFSARLVRVIADIADIARSLALRAGLIEVVPAPCVEDVCACRVNHPAAFGRLPLVAPDPADHETPDLTRDNMRELVEHVEWLREEFPRRYGRELSDGDPLFPDFDAPGLVPVATTAAKVEAQMVGVMERAGVHPSKIYAYQQSGILLTSENESVVDPAAVMEWYAALDRFETLSSVGR